MLANPNPTYLEVLNVGLRLRQFSGVHLRRMLPTCSIIVTHRVRVAAAAAAAAPKAQPVAPLALGSKLVHLKRRVVVRNGEGERK